MKKPYMFLFCFISLLFMECVYGLLVFDIYLRTSLINIFIFTIPASAILSILLSIFKSKINKIIGYVIFSLLGLLYSVQFVFKAVFNSFFSLSIFTIADQALDFGKETFISILKNFHGILLFFVPLIIFIVLKNKLPFNRYKMKELLFVIGIFIIGSTSFVINLNLQKSGTYSAYALYFKINQNSLNIENLGVLNASMLDTYRTTFGFKEELQIVENTDEENNDDVFTYDANIDESIDFDTLNDKASGELKTLDTYMKKDKATLQNKYTGLFEGKNLIYIVAESFSDIGVSETLTPTLYKLVNTGFVFNNFYAPVNLSTIGGEYQDLTGLYASGSILSEWRSGKNAWPYGLANMFSDSGYTTYAFHNNGYQFQSRDKYLASIGFTNYSGCWNGLEELINCHQWPRSDVEMINVTTDKYLSSEDPFLVYYMTNSGHFAYSWSNAMSSKHRSAVSSLPYSDKVKAYIATQIELDQSLELLLEDLETAGELDDTVIVLTADHYPYDLTLSEINEVATSPKDSVVEINHSNLIVWNSNLKTIPVDKVSMTIDVLPTVYNLFGLKYDSRLLVGKDIFSTTDGVAIFTNRSWVTDKGTYYSSTGRFTSSNNENVSSDYISNMNAIVSNRLNTSKMIVENNYYKHVFSK